MGRAGTTMNDREAGTTTLGDLIVALTDETGRFVHDEDEVYKVVAYIVTDLFWQSKLISRETH
jgi:hypothetical protein